MKRFSAALLALSLFAFPALAQDNGVSTTVQAGNLRGSATAGSSSSVIIGGKAPTQRGDDKCDTHGVTVTSPNGSSSSSASVSSSGGGTAALAGGGSPGSRTQFFGCEARNASPGNKGADHD